MNENMFSYLHLRYATNHITFKSVKDFKIKSDDFKKKKWCEKEFKRTFWGTIR